MKTGFCRIDSAAYIAFLIIGAWLSLAIAATPARSQKPPTLSHFEAMSTAGGIRLLWEVAEEWGLGFNVLRSDEAENGYRRINEHLIVGGPAFSYLDPVSRPVELYFYKLEAIDLEGYAYFFGPVSNLRSLAGNVTISVEQASPGGESVLISWRSALDLNHLEFHVYRSVDGRAPIRLTEEAVQGSEPHAFLDSRALSDVPLAYRIEALGPEGAVEMLPATLIRTIPRHSLAQSQPNPFRALKSAARIRFSLVGESHVTLRVFDITGRQIRVLVDGPLPAGDHEAVWDGRGGGGAPVSSGIYFYQLEAGAFTEVRKLVIGG